MILDSAKQVRKRVGKECVAMETQLYYTCRWVAFETMGILSFDVSAANPVFLRQLSLDELFSITANHIKRLQGVIHNLFAECVFSVSLS